MNSDLLLHTLNDVLLFYNYTGGGWSLMLSTYFYPGRRYFLDQYIHVSINIYIFQFINVFFSLRNTCRALFEHHKLLFSLHMCMQILKSDNKLNVAEYLFLLKGGIVLNRENQPDNPCSSEYLKNS